MARAVDAWRIFTYRWEPLTDGVHGDDAQAADALLLDGALFEPRLAADPDGGTRTLIWCFPDEKGCDHCHKDRVLGPTVA